MNYEPQDIYSNSTGRRPAPQSNPTNGGRRPSGPPAGKKKTHRALTNSLVSFFLVLSLILSGVFYFAGFYQFEGAGQVDSRDFESVVKSIDEDVTYFLIVGTDEEQTLTDVMMVLCFDHGHNTANILQIPRDTYIGSDIPTGKVNAVYGSAAEGESRINVLMSRLNTYLGLPIDHYAIVSLSAFQTIVDAVDGVDVYVPNSFSAYNSLAEMYTFQSGINHMNGRQAEAFVRNRSGKGYSMGDMSRVEAQRNFYAAFLKKLLGMDFTQMKKVAETCFDKVTTDMSIGLVYGYMEELKGMTTDSFAIYAVPGQGGTFRPQGQQYSRSYYSIHKQSYVDLINQYFMPYSEKITASQLKITELASTNTGDEIDSGGVITGYIDTTEAGAASSATGSGE